MNSIELRKIRGFLWGAALLLVLPLRAADAPVATTAPGTEVPVPAVEVPKLEPRAFSWRELSFELPASIKIFEGDAVNADGQPVRAWYADVDYSDRSIRAKALISQTANGRETTSSIGKKVGALVAINGGYFTMRGKAVTLNTVINDGKVVAENPKSVGSAEAPVHIMRGVFGIRAARQPAEQVFDLKWVAHIDGKPIAYPSPLPNEAGKPAPPPSLTFPEGGMVWDVQEAIGGGPSLVSNSEIRVTSVEEAFGPNHVKSRHPRTAVGSYVRDGRPHLILFVVDGRQKTHSMGMNLPELAQAMKDLGCSEALNLDGGGSSAFVVKDKALNKPSDGRERNVTSALTIVADDELRVLAVEEKPKE